MSVSPASPPRRRRAAIAAIAVVAVVAACGSTGASATTAIGPSSSTAPSSGPKSASQVAAAPFDPAGLHVTLESVATGLDAPLAIVNAHDGTNRLFVVEQGGRIRIVKDGTLQPAPFLDVSDRISSGGERGLLGLAFHPGFPADPRLFVDYTDPNGDTQVSSFAVNPASPDRADPGSEVKILRVQQPYANHNGGEVVFGPDGKLFISFGDGGSEGDPQGYGQNPRTLLGKILRIDVDSRSGDRQYAIPPDNPFADGAGGAPEIWLTGLRNPWRISFDRATGDLWIGDVGQSAWEEIDVQRAGAPGGTNYGWNRMEGRHCYQPSTGCDETGLTMPVTEYGHDQGCTVIGGSVVRGPDQPALVGGYIFADYCSGRVWAIDPSTDAYRDPTAVADSGHRIAAFGEDEAGNLYAADIAGGAVLRVAATRG